MLKFSVWVVSLFAMTMVVSESQTLAGRHFSRDARQDGDQTLEEARSNFSRYQKLGEQLEAYQNLSRFEPEDLWKTEIELASFLTLIPDKDYRQTAVVMYGNALIYKDNFSSIELGNFLSVLSNFFSLTDLESSLLVNNFQKAFANSDVGEIESNSFKLLELLKDIPDAAEVIFESSFGELHRKDSEKSILFLRRLVEEKSEDHPAILSKYLEELSSNESKIPPIQDDLRRVYYRRMFLDDRFKFKFEYIYEYALLCLRSKRFKKGKDFLLEILEEGTFDTEKRSYLYTLLGTCYLKLNKHKKAASRFEIAISFTKDKDHKNFCELHFIDQLFKSKNYEKATEVLQKIFESQLSHLQDQKDHKKVRQREDYAARRRQNYVEAIKFQQAQTQKETKDKPEPDSSTFSKKAKVSSIPIPDANWDPTFFEAHNSKSSPSNTKMKRDKQKTRKQPNPALNKKRDKTRNKGEKEEVIEKKPGEIKTAEQLLKGTPYKTLIKIFRVFVGEIKGTSCKISVEKVGHLFKCLGYDYEKDRGRGGHSMVFCNSEEKGEKDFQRKGITFASRKNLGPSAIIGIASTLLEYGIYPKQFEQELKDLL